MKIFLPSQAKVFGNVSGEARIPTKREERLFLVILQFTCSDHHGSTILHSGNHNWRGLLMNLMTSNISRFRGELIPQIKYSEDEVYIVQREQNTTDIIWLVLFCSVWSYIGLDVQWSPREQVFQNAVNRYLVVLLSSLRDNCRGLR